MTGVIQVPEQRFERPESKTEAVREKTNALTLDTRELEPTGSDLVHMYGKPVSKGGTVQNSKREMRSG